MATGLSIAAVSYQDSSRLGAVFEPPESSEVDLLEALDVVSPEVIVLHILIGMLIATLMIRMATQKIVQRRHRNLLRWKLIWQFCVTPFGQSSFVVRTVRTRYLVALFVLCSSAMVMFFKNKISTDLISWKPPFLINSIDDFLQTDRRPQFSATHGLRHEFETSKGSKYEEVWKRCKDRVSRCMADTSKVLKVMANLIGGKRVLFFPQFVHDFVERLYCSMGKDVDRQNLYHQSKDVISTTVHGKF